MTRQSSARAIPANLLELVDDASRKQAATGMVGDTGREEPGLNSLGPSVGEDTRPPVFSALGPSVGDDTTNRPASPLGPSVGGDAREPMFSALGPSVGDDGLPPVPARGRRE